MKMTTEEDNEKTSLLKAQPSGPDVSNGTPSYETSLRRAFPNEETGDGWREETPQLVNANEVICRVCENVIQIEHLKKQYVAKCSRCNEATPIFSAPPGKKYVRCCCCCLLICRSSSERVYCPRSNCNRIIHFSPQDRQFSIQGGNGTMRNFICPHCDSNFLFNVLSNSAARCPTCHNHIAVDVKFKYVRGIGYGILAASFFIIPIVLMAVTFPASHTYIYFICLGFLILFLYFVYKSFYYSRLKISSSSNE
uniref:Phosphatidylinositol-4,5-bisphosphate 4-phosphatase n=1 Tax=Lepeophtheirus salmonis TaxID=72036 RepID=C1BSQ9_LEPSM|nr:Transmembrane protein 55B-B [Lepeophtheirus salmonis]